MATSNGYAEASSNFTVSLCVLNQWALDFSGNTERVLRSIKLSKEAGARYRLGPELELCGYGCEDHFHELDTYNHSLECLATILKQTTCEPQLQDIICDIGMPVMLSGVGYNCRVIILNGRILLIRPKLVLADGGLHRETRWFTAWPHKKCVVDYPLPSVVRHASRDQQNTAPFGDALLHCIGDEGHVTIGLETCEELWIGSPPHLKMYLSGADVVLNASASHHELRKLSRRIILVEMASRSSGGGLYAYTNLRGCDSERICYDGGAMAAVCGHLVHLSKQFGLEDVEVSTVTVDLVAIRSKRIADKSFGRTSAASTALACGQHKECSYPVIEVQFPACHKPNWLEQNTCGKFARPLFITHDLLTPEEEIALGPSLWLWDTLRRSHSSGFFMCLSGGLDSASVACIVLSLANQLHQYLSRADTQVVKFCCNIFNESESTVLALDIRGICSRLLFTCYMPSENSSRETADRAERLANAIGSNHLNGPISSTVSSLIGTAMVSLNLSEPPKFMTEGGSLQQSLALQNVQARSRMVLAYLLAQLIPSYQKRQGGLLLLGSANLDENLRGYFTKYDCSSADLNPIGSISKADLRRFIRYCADTLSRCLEDPYRTQLQDVLKEIASAHPTAELMPLTSDGKIEQTDEEEMGLTYNMLSLFGRLRKIENCGPYSMMRCLLDGVWVELREELPAECVTPDGGATSVLACFIAEKVKLFFRAYAVNRHKSTILTPAYHTEAYSADDNRFDLRPYLYPADWTYQFSCIDALVADWESQMSSQSSSS